MNRSFERLRVSTMDLMQVHNLVDAETHLRTLAGWKESGRVRYIGITHYQVSAHAELERIIRRGGIDVVQFNYSLVTRAAEKRLLPAAAEHQVAMLINKPFETGALFDRVGTRPLPACARNRVQQISSAADRAAGAAAFGICSNSDLCPSRSNCPCDAPGGPDGLGLRAHVARVSGVACTRRKGRLWHEQTGIRPARHDKQSRMGVIQTRGRCLVWRRGPFP
jgi:hypothetical protein